jgi:hypothetical protein
MSKAAAAVLAFALLAAGCGRGDGDPAGNGAGQSPAGRWKFDREALLAALAKDHADEGPERVAEEQQRARETNLELELRGDGLYRMQTLSLGFEQRMAGTWRLEGTRLLLTPQRVDGKEVEPTRVDEARFVHGRIEIDFDHKTFVLVRP